MTNKSASSDIPRAVVVDFNPKCLVRPKVQGLRDPCGESYADPALEEIDLCLHRDVQIAFVGETDVREFQASQETADVPGVLALA